MSAVGRDERRVGQQHGERVGRPRRSPPPPPDGSRSRAAACPRRRRARPGERRPPSTASSGEMTHVSHPRSRLGGVHDVLEHREGERAALQRREHGAQPGLRLGQGLHGQGDGAHGRPRVAHRRAVPSLRDPRRSSAGALVPRREDRRVATGEAVVLLAVRGARTHPGGGAGAHRVQPHLLPRSVRERRGRRPRGPPPPVPGEGSSSSASRSWGRRSAVRDRSL